MALLTRKRVLAAKAEATCGTAETLNAATGAFNAFDVQLQPTIDFDEREGQGGFAPLAGTLGPYAGTIKFKTEIYGDASTAPAWASTLLAGCGYVETTGTFAPSSLAPAGTGTASRPRTLTIGAFCDGRLKKLRGAMGTAVFTFTTGRRVMVEWTFTGIWVTPADDTLIQPDYPTPAPLRFVSSGLLIAGAWAPPISELTLDLGAQVFLREDSTDASGWAHAHITGRLIRGKINPEASLVATKDTHGIWTGRTEQSLAISLGATGNIVTFAAPKLQFRNVQEEDRNKIEAEGIEFQLNRSDLTASAGDDELAIDVVG